MKLKNIPVNRITAVFIALFIAMFSMNFSFDTNASNTSRTYSIYKATTGAYIGGYTLNTLDIDDNLVSPHYVFGNDDRVIDFTKSGVVKILSSNEFLGTGFVVNKNTIATAAHCVKGYTVNKIKFFDSNGNVSKTITPSEVHIPKPYVSGNSSYDYALIKVNEDLSDYAIFDLGVALDSAIDNHLSVSVTGFPNSLNNQLDDNINNFTTDNMYTGIGTLTPSTSLYGKDYQLCYTADTSSGNSGSPVYITTSYYGKVYYTVIGINTTGSNKYNSGVRMSTDLLHFYMNNPNV